MKDQTVRGRLQFYGFDRDVGITTMQYTITDDDGSDVVKVCSMPPFPKIVDEKIAILKLTGQGVRVPGVGKKQSALVYYLHFTVDEIKQMESDYEEQRSGSGLGDGKQPSQAGASI